MTSTSSITTAQQLFEAGDIGRCELVRGELAMMTPMNPGHAGLANEIAFHLTAHVKRSGLGRIYVGDPGFVIARNPDTVRAPDVAFVRAERVREEPDHGYYEGAPDLAVEVLSPTDRAGEVLAKVQDWLGAGCRLVWVVDPKRQTVACYCADGHVKMVRSEEQLSGGDVLPGFDLVVARLFD
jgi:Uma2 family endonuclease